MADAVEEFESSSCHTTIELESVGTGTPNSLCSTPDIEIRGNENCSTSNSKQPSKSDDSFAGNCQFGVSSHETSFGALRHKKRELGNIEACSSQENCRE